MEATIIKATIKLILTRKIKKIFTEELSAKKPSDRFHLLVNAEMHLPLLTICLIFLLLHICFTTFVHIVLNNAGRTFPKKKEEIRVNALQGPVETYFRQKCLSAVMAGLIGILEEVSKLNTVLCFIRKSVIKHHSE